MVYTLSVFFTKMRALSFKSLVGFGRNFKDAQLFDASKVSNRVEYMFERILTLPFR